MAANWQKMPLLFHWNATYTVNHLLCVRGRHFLEHFNYHTPRLRRRQMYSRLKSGRRNKHRGCGEDGVGIFLARGLALEMAELVTLGHIEILQQLFEEFFMQCRGSHWPVWPPGFNYSGRNVSILLNLWWGLRGGGNERDQQHHLGPCTTRNTMNLYILVVNL